MFCFYSEFNPKGKSMSDTVWPSPHIQAHITSHGPSLDFLRAPGDAGLDTNTLASSVFAIRDPV